MTALHHLARSSLGLLFVVAATTKLGDIRALANGIGDFGLVPDDSIVATAWIVALLELLAGAALVANLRGSLICVLLLLACFVGVLGYGIALGLDIDCGCFGPSYHADLRTQVVVDLVLVAWCGLIIWSRKKCRANIADPKASTTNLSGDDGDST